MSKKGKMKANRKTFTGVLRVFIDKYQIPDGEWFSLEDVNKFRKEEEKMYLKEKGIETIEDYRKLDKYIIEKYKKSPHSRPKQGKDLKR